MGIGAALIATAVIGAGASVYSAQQQKKAAEEEQARLRAAEEEARRRQEQIAKDTAPEAQTAKAIKFGTGDRNKVGNTSEFLVPKLQKSQLGTTGSSGLGFNV